MGDETHGNGFDLNYLYIIRCYVQLNMKRFVIAFLSILSMVRADCFNFKRDGSEAGVDCGGPDCFQRCELGSSCTDGLDCDSGFCMQHRCVVIESSGGPYSGSGAAPVPSPETIPQEDLPSPIMITIILVGLGLSCFGIYYIIHFGENSIRIYKPVESAGDSYDECDTDTEIEMSASI